MGSTGHLYGGLIGSDLLCNRSGKAGALESSGEELARHDRPAGQLQLWSSLGIPLTWPRGVSSGWENKRSDSGSVLRLEPTRFVNGLVVN